MSFLCLTRPSGRQVVVARCNECGETACDEHGTLHFPSRAAAFRSEYLADWRTDRTGIPALCETCTAALDCDTYGHDYGDWYACRCNGAIAWHAAHGCPEYRYCQRCGVNDNPAYPDTTTARPEVA